MTHANSLAAAFDHAVRLLQNNQPEAARYVFRQILAVVPEHSDVLHFLGLCDLVEGRPGAAVDWIRRSLVDAPSDPVRYNNLAVALIRLGRFEEAVEASGHALDLQADYADALNNRGSALAELGRDAQALDAYTRAVGLVGDSAEIYANKGHIHLRLGQPREALECYTKALDIDGAHEQAKANLSLSSHLAVLSYFDPDSAYLAECPVAPESLEEFRVACRQLNDGWIDAAAEGFTALLARYPEWTEARVLAVIAEYRRDRFVEGLENCAKLVSNSPPPALKAVLDEYSRRLAAAERLRGMSDVVGHFERSELPPRLDDEDHTLHILSSFHNRAGTELHCLGLAEALRDRVQVHLWSMSPHIHEAFVDAGIRLIGATAGNFPQRGTLAVIGAWHPIGAWYQEAQFRRVIVAYNVDEPEHLERIIRSLALPGKPKVEIVFASEWMKAPTGLPGHFEPSPVDLHVFRPRTSEPHPDHFVVGRLSRDVHYKFHPGAPAFFSQLASRGIRVRLMGATILADSLGSTPGIELLPVNTEPPEDFLRSLDCFVYRTHCYMPEAWGRVVTEAMAMGLPVVAHVQGGFAQIIEHGRNGFLFHSDEEALHIIDTLRASPGLRRSIGEAARATMEALYGESSFDRYWRFYAD